MLLFSEKGCILTATPHAQIIDRIAPDAYVILRTITSIHTVSDNHLNPKIEQIFRTDLSRPQVVLIFSN